MAVHQFFLQLAGGTAAHTTRMWEQCGPVDIAATQAEQNQHPDVFPALSNSLRYKINKCFITGDQTKRKGRCCMTVDPQIDSHMSQNNHWKDLVSKTIFLFILMTEDQLPLRLHTCSPTEVTCVKKASLRLTQLSEIVSMTVIRAKEQG